MNDSKKITDGALLTALYIILLLIAIFVPFIIIFMLFVLPIPVVVYATRYNWKPTLLMILVILLLALLIIPVISIPLTILTSIGGLMIGTAIHQKRSAYETWARGTIGFVVGILFILLYSQFVLQVNWSQEIDTVIQDSIEMTESIVTQFGMENEMGEQLQFLEQQMYIFKDLLPASIAMLSIFLAIICQWLSYKVMNRVENRRLFFPPFKKLNFPISIIWIYLIAMILSLLTLDPNSTIYLIVINTFALTSLFIIIQGFSFVFFFADIKKIHKALPISIVIISLLIPQIFLVLIRIIGIIDIGFSLKAKLEKEKPSS